MAAAARRKRMTCVLAGAWDSTKGSVVVPKNDQRSVVKLLCRGQRRGRTRARRSLEKEERKRLVQEDGWMVDRGWLDFHQFHRAGSRRSFRALWQTGLGEKRRVEFLDVRGAALALD